MKLFTLLLIATGCILAQNENWLESGNIAVYPNFDSRKLKAGSEVTTKIWIKSKRSKCAKKTGFVHTGKWFIKVKCSSSNEGQLTFTPMGQPVDVPKAAQLNYFSIFSTTLAGKKQNPHEGYRVFEAETGVIGVPDGKKMKKIKLSPWEQEEDGSEMFQGFVDLNNDGIPEGISSPPHDLNRFRVWDLRPTSPKPIGTI